MAFTAQEEIEIQQPADSVASDSVLQQTGMELHYGIVMERPASETSRTSGRSNTGISWVLTTLILVFVVVCLRYRKNNRYFAILLSDVTERRERHNAFNDTVRETSFIWLLNILWCACAGILLYGYMFKGEGSLLADGLDMGKVGICIGMAGAYTLFLTMAYAVVGFLFSDSAKASAWVKSYLSTQGLESVILFPLALLGLCVPGLLGAMIFMGGLIFIIAKFLFIYKGFCIFFTESATWVLFLYYLCSLEIVPVVLTCVLAGHLCGVS